MNNISVELDKNGIAILRFDNPEGSANKLSQEDIAWMNEFVSKGISGVLGSWGAAKSSAVITSRKLSKGMAPRRNAPQR